MAPIDYLAVGHVTLDVLPDGRRVPGGAVTYAAITAAAMGLRTGIVTRAEPGWAELASLPGISVHIVPAANTTTFVNTYDAEHRRTQHVLALAPPMAPDDIPAAWRDVAIAHFGTVDHELDPDVMDAVRADFVGLGPQGWLRHIRLGEAVSRGRWHGADGLLTRADAVMLSDEDLDGEPRGEAWFADHTDLLVMTAGPDGARARRHHDAWQQPALPATPLDPTGAGDTFAAAFFIYFAESSDVEASLRFASAAAAFKVEHAGPGGIPGRGEVMRRAGLE
jgi:sugar/nucleoside kinase (ribokinase family)